MEVTDNKADSEERSPKYRKGFALFYSFYALNRKTAKSSPFCEPKQVCSNSYQISESQQCSGSFSLQLEDRPVFPLNFTTTESFYCRISCQESPSVLGFLLTNFSICRFNFLYVFVHLCTFPHEALLLHATQDINKILTIYCCLEFRNVFWPSVCGGLNSAHKKVTSTFAHFLIRGLI